MPENKHLLVPYSWLPFGAGTLSRISFWHFVIMNFFSKKGPRNCIGMRFAYQEIKLCLATIVRKFRFERAPSTPVPIFFNTFELLTTPNIELKISVRWASTVKCCSFLCVALLQSTIIKSDKPNLKWSLNQSLKADFDQSTPHCK